MLLLTKFLPSEKFDPAWKAALIAALIAQAASCCCLEQAFKLMRVSEKIMQRIISNI